MIHVLVIASVHDFNKWKTGFEAASPLRSQSGSTGEQVFRPTGKPNEVVILGQYESLEKAQAKFSSPEFRQAAQAAGMTAPPQVTFLEPLFELPT